MPPLQGRGGSSLYDALVRMFSPAPPEDPLKRAPSQQEALPLLMRLGIIPTPAQEPLPESYMGPRTRTGEGETFGMRGGKFQSLDIPLPRQPYPEQVAEPEGPEGLPPEDLAARTVYGESRGDPASQAAVAAVILNRLKAKQKANPEATVSDVALAPKQFSAWNEGDPNREAMLAVSPEDETLAKIKLLVASMMAGKTKDPTGGATMYHAEGASPGWDFSKLSPAGTFGAHTFYRQRRGR